MSDPGYTLTDTLAGLAILGLGLGAATGGLGVLTHTQLATSTLASQTHAMARAQTRLDALLAAQGPFRDRDNAFDGREQHLSFDCAPATCGAAITISQGASRLRIIDHDVTEIIVFRGKTAGFRYVAAGAQGPSWPTFADRPQRLEAIAIVDQGEQPLTMSRLWRDQDVDCAFDPISQDCR